MRVEFKGLTLFLEDEGPKAEQVAAILFKGVFPHLDPAPEPAPSPPPADFAQFWDRLSAIQKRELVRLSKGRMDRDEIESELGITPRRLQGQHVLISKLAGACGISTPIVGRGNWPDRFYELDPERVTLVQRLGEDDEAIARFARHRRGL